MEEQAEYKVCKKEPKPDLLVRVGIIIIVALLLAVLIGAFGLMIWNIYNDLFNG